MNFKKLLYVFVAAVIAVSTVQAQKMPNDLKKQLKEKAAALYPKDAAEKNMWYTNQFYAWQAMQASSSTLPKQDYEKLKLAAEKKFPMDFVAQTDFITRQTSQIESLAPVKDILGAENFAVILENSLKKSDGDYAKAAPEIIKQAEAKKSIDALSGDTAKLSALKDNAKKQSPTDFCAQLEQITKQLGGAAASDSATAQTASGGSNQTQIRESSFERSKRLQKETSALFLSSTCRHGEANAGIFSTMMETKAVIVPVFDIKDITENELISNLGNKIEIDRKNIYISKTEPIALFLIKDFPSGAKPIKQFTTEHWQKVLGTQLYLAGRLRENIKSIPLTINSLSENTVNFDTRIAPGTCSGAIFVAPDDMSVGGILMSEEIPLKICEDFTDHSQLSRLIGSMKSNKVAFRILRLDTLKQWEKLDLKKLEKQEKEFEEISAFIADYIDFFKTQTLRNLRSKKYIGKFANRAFAELNVRKLKIEEHNKRYKSYLNSVKNSLPLQINKIKPDEFYSIHRAKVAAYKEILESMKSSLEKLLKSDFTTFMKSDSNLYRND